LPIFGPTANLVHPEILLSSEILRDLWLHIRSCSYQLKFDGCDKLSTSIKTGLSKPALSW
jgi:hypothetical protein